MLNIKERFDNAFEILSKTLEDDSEKNQSNINFWIGYVTALRHILEDEKNEQQT